MPRGDGTGPVGTGSMTGRAMGYCAGYDAPGFTNPGFGRGRGRGFGRGMAGSFKRFWRDPAQPFYPEPANLNKEEQKKVLEQEKKAIEEELKAVNERITELSK